MVYLLGTLLCHLLTHPTEPLIFSTSKLTRIGPTGSITNVMTTSKWFNVFALLSVDTEEASLLHEEATMTIEELLVRYGQNLNAVKHAAALR